MEKKILLLSLLLIQLEIGGQTIIDFRGNSSTEITFEDTAYYKYLFIDTLNYNLWHIGKPQKEFFNSAYSIPNALITDTDSTYKVGKSYVIFKVDWTEWDGFVFSFMYKINSEENVDGGLIEISSDNGKTWHNYFDLSELGSLDSYNDYTRKKYKIDSIKSANTLGITGVSDGWLNGHWEVDIWNWLSPYRNDTIFIRLCFSSDSINNNYDGWMIDNLAVSYISVSTNKISWNDAVSVNPMPITDKSVISINDLISLPYELIVYDQNGRVLYNNIINIRHFNLDKIFGSINSGCYILQVRSKENFAQLMIVK